MRVRFALSALAAVTLAMPPGARSDAAGQPKDGSAVSADSCPSSFPANWRCLEIAVPEDYSAPEGKKAEVRVVVAPAQRPKPHREAVILIQGGPGLSGTAVTEAGFLPSIGALQATHDLVVVDERQVSGPEALTCPPSGPPGEAASWGEDFFSPAHLQSCLARSAGRANLKSLTTSNFARDIDSVRAALGYDSVEFYSTNYGGLIVQEYIRRFPGKVRAAVLADTAPMDEPVSWNSDRWTLRAIGATLAGCRADWECRRAYPNIEHEFHDLMTRSAAGGLKVAIDASGGGQTVTFDRDTLLAFFRAHFHFMRDVAAIPYEIHELSSGNPARAGAIGQEIFGYQHAAFGGVALGVWMSVECAEEAPAIRARMSRGERPGSGRIAAIVAACRTWPHGEPPADFHEPVRSNVPLLLLSSPMEPGYPAELAPRVAAGFSRVRIVLDANHGHVFDDDWSMCLGPQAVAFLDTLDLDAVDSRCAARFRFRPFKLPSSRE